VDEAVRNLAGQDMEGVWHQARFRSIDVLVARLDVCDADRLRHDPLQLNRVLHGEWPAPDDQEVQIREAWDRIPGDEASVHG
jgi:hypothetical protein